VAYAVWRARRASVIEAEDRAEHETLEPLDDGAPLVEMVGQRRRENGP
jgi:hypothetical protein